ncbi:SDR family oxidoreductase [Microbacterium sp. NIBRBAC000506063]|uniref:SDR family oxidoreductase n=1 Tax=Microbacterium sp. NIBRBAC000506063 TaxID=2734618 RepID=UPI001BB51E00|nr:SDR family oxidoreductase [Microbacterium sp. NIBRBAC000506063]QTV80386.1 SDR family oxidoreductase [Microbacterium sp. NIBRBAC000506063]
MSRATPFSLDDRTALVTGAGSGIGRGIAHGLAAAGAEVILVGRSEAVHRTAEEITSSGGAARAVQADLSDLRAADELPRTIGEDTEVDILVNCAGTIYRSPFLEHEDERWRDVLDINLEAPRVLSRAFGAQMVDRGRGKIVNIASLLSFQGGVNVAAYTTSKHALVGLTKALANEWASRGVQVNAIAPGYIDTDNTAPLRADAQRDAEILSRIPTGRWGTADDLAGAAVYLSSAASDYVTGHTLVVDGGWMSR